MNKEALERLEAIEWAENGACYICKAVEPTHYSYCALKQAIDFLKQQHFGSNTSEARLLKALEPIVEWYGGGTEGNRSGIEILTDVVGDLQKDRAEVLTQSKRIVELEATIKAGGECCDMLQERIDILSEGKAKKSGE